MGDPDKPVANGQAGQASQNKTPLQVEAKKFEEIVFCSRKYRTLIENKFHWTFDLKLRSMFFFKYFLVS